MMKQSRSLRHTIFLFVTVMMAGWSMHGGANDKPSENGNSPENQEFHQNNQTAIFAGGCFWCMEPPFDKIPGVKSTVSGYIGGQEKNPTYEQVSAGKTGHAEAIKIVFDPSIVSYQTLLDIFWKNIDPTVKDRQFCDQGRQYRSAIFPQSNTQHEAAKISLSTLESSGRFAVIHTTIELAEHFYEAEEYHQDYYLKNPIRYKFYRSQCGRDARLDDVWGKDKGL